MHSHPQSTREGRSCIFVDERNKILRLGKRSFSKFWKGSLRKQDPIPAIGTAAGLLIGSLVVGLFFLIWYYCLQRHRNSDAAEYVNALSIVSRATSDNKQYQRRKQPKSKPSLWTRLLPKLQSTTAVPSLKITGPTCYLLYEPDSSGRLVQYYSMTPLTQNDMPNDVQHTLVAVWKPASHIASHKFTQNGGRSVLIGNCSVGFRGKHNYCNGVCQFLKSVHANGGGMITLLNPPPSDDDQQPALPIDLYLYLNEIRPQYQKLPLEPNTTQRIPSNTLAVACLPQKTPFYKNTK